MWAAKEAVFRALGTTWKRGMNWTDIEVVCENGGPPQVVVSGPTRELMVDPRRDADPADDGPLPRLRHRHRHRHEAPSTRPMEDTALDD